MTTTISRASYLVRGDDVSYNDDGGDVVVDGSVFGTLLVYLLIVLKMMTNTCALPLITHTITTTTTTWLSLPSSPISFTTIASLSSTISTPHHNRVSYGFHQLRPRVGVVVIGCWSWSWRWSVRTLYYLYDQRSQLATNIYTQVANRTINQIISQASQQAAKKINKQADNR